MKEYPLVSIMIATYNSGKILERPLKAIANQSYPKDKMEILIIDGGSKDDTKTIATKYGCKIYDNPKTDPVSAKMIGWENAHGKYLITVDHDEVLVNPDSIKNRVDALIENNECKVAFCSGYKCPNGYSGLNEYISEFGDPFSLFYYRFSKGYRFYKKALDNRAKLLKESDNYYIYDFNKDLDRIIIEIVCLATMIDLEYFKSIIDVNQFKEEFVHLFYKMIDGGYTKTILAKNDPLEHYSVDSLKRYLPKLRWRIINNVHYADRAAQGFEGRQKQTGSSILRKYLFPVYSVTTIFPFLEGIYYAISRKNIFFMVHPFLCWYVTYYIVYQYALKIIGMSPKRINYDGSGKSN